MQIVKFKNGYEAFMEDDLAKIYEKKGKITIEKEEKSKPSKPKEKKADK